MNYSLSAPAQIITRLEEIERDLATSDQEKSAAAYFQAKRDYEKAFAKAYMEADGPEHTRKQDTILKLVKNGEYDKYVIAEAAYEGAKAGVRVLETRSSIGQSLLRSMGREA